MSSLRSFDLDKIANMYLESIARYANYLTMDEKIPRSEWQLEMQNLLSYVKDIASELSTRGFSSAKNEELYKNHGSIISILLSIKSGSPVGYKIESVWQVINSIICQNSERATQWHTLFLIALKVYPKEFNDKQNDNIYEWRKKVTNSIKEGSIVYARNDRYDKLISLLFPEMSNSLVSDFGKRSGITKSQNLPDPEKENLYFDSESTDNGIDDFKKGNRFYFSVLKRLECISRNKTIGRYIGNNSAPIWETISAIIHERPSETEWLIVYITAIDEYKPSMNSSRTNLYQNWRRDLGKYRNTKSSCKVH